MVNEHSEEGPIEERRKRRLLAPRFQRRFRWFLVGMVVVISLLIIALFVLYGESVLANMEALAFSPLHPAYRIVEAKIHILLWSVGVTLLFLSISLFLLMDALSQKMVGPIFACLRGLSRLANKEQAKNLVHLRKGDYFQDLEKDVNRVIEQFTQPSDVSS